MREHASRESRSGRSEHARDRKKALSCRLSAKGRGPIRLIGLTGGIATGKSTASEFFAEEGAQVIDADQVARRVVELGEPALEEIRSVFGDEVLLPDGSLDRDALGALVFRNPSARARVNEIVHPKVDASVRERVDAIFAEDPEALVIYDVPLLFEAGLEGRVDLVVVVYAPREEQIRRLVARDGMPYEEAEVRLTAQMDIEEKARKADVILDNQGPVKQLRKQVKSLVRRVKQRNRGIRA